MDQNLLIQASMLERQSQELEENLELIDKQISELQVFQENLKFFGKTKKSESLSSLGKGVFVKTNIENNDLYVNVGSDVLVKKSLAETISILEIQINKLIEAKANLVTQIDLYNQALQRIISQLEESEKKAH